MVKDRSLKRATMLALVLAPLVLAGCAETVGAGAGAYAGHELSHGSALGTVGGAVGGAAIGHILTH